jgi:ATP-dependent exoDNAse (exonuclease V) beta subunit
MTIAHSVILASAGTGKTYRLSHHYIGLLADGAAPEQILATTFTRKAAGEILGRILLRLADGASDDAVCRTIGETLGRDDITRARCLEWLQLLVQRLDRLQVCTLDAFFVQLATVLGHDLGLPPGWSLADEYETHRLRDEAVAAMTAGMTASETATLIRALSQGEDGLTRRVHDALRDDVVRSAFALHRVAAPGAWERYEAPPGIDDDELEQALCALERAELISPEKGALGARWEKAREAALIAARCGDWRTLVGKGLGKALLQNDGLYYKQAIPADVVAALRPLLAQAIHELLRSIEKLNQSYLALLTRYGEAEERAKRERRRMAFDDLPRFLLGGLGVDGDVVAHRLDGRIEHLLLDEFQDTSVQQWQVLEPLARKLITAGEGRHTFFCVGDVKQSIYGWRGGESRLLSGLSERLELGEPETMRESRRSSPVVLDAINQIFADVEHSPAFAGEAARAEAAARWREGYEPHVAHDAHPGHAALWVVPSDGAGSAERSQDVLAAAANHIAALVARAPWLSVGALVRRKRFVPRLLAALRSRGVAASGEGGTPLTDSGAVRLALSVLQLADHPGDTAAAFHVANSPLGDALGISSAGDEKARRRLSRRVRRELACTGYGAWLATLQAQIEASDAFTVRDRRRFGQLVDLGLAAGARAGLRPSAFCAHVAVEAVEDSSSASVRVMTVHGSKGLEFDAVVLSDLDGPLSQPPKLLVGQRDPWVGPETLLSGVRSDLLPLDERLELLSNETWGRSTEEALCVLYVSLTRAARSLDLFIAQPPETKGKRPKVQRTPAGLVRAALAGATQKDSPDPDTADGSEVQGEETLELRPAWIHPDADPEWWLALRPQDEPSSAAVAATSAPLTSAGPIRLQPGKRPRFLPRHAPSSASAGGSTSAAELLGAPEDTALLRGSAAHLWFEQVIWLDDFSASDEELLSLARRQLATHVDLLRWLAEWRSWLQADALAELLSRPDGEAEVWRERSFLLPVTTDAGEHLLSGSFDRVHLHGPPGAPTRATVIDFKTDTIADGQALARRSAHHAPQLAEYRRAVASLTGLEEKDIRCVLAFVAAGRVVAV